MVDRLEGISRLLRTDFAEPRTRFQATVLAVQLAFALAGPVAAQSNPFFNSDLDSDAVGWVFHSASPPPGWDAQDRDGCEGSGSAVVSGQMPFGLVASILQCIPVFGGESLQVEIEALPIFGLDPISAFVGIDYTAGGCDIPGFWSDFTEWEVLAVGSWSRIDARFLVPAGAISARAVFVLSSPSAFDTLFDGAYASELPYRIFNDGFDYGSSCRW